MRASPVWISTYHQLEDSTSERANENIDCAIEINIDTMCAIGAVKDMQDNRVSMSHIYAILP